RVFVDFRLHVEAIPVCRRLCKAPDGTLAKCDMCIDRVKNGLVPVFLSDWNLSNGDVFSGVRPTSLISAVR
ncbi:MAG: hypothetical protein KAU60_04145, partial [Desulfobacterales bacterium]|nr:hypothetical protein [Desulfobacterales bacterium]